MAISILRARQLQENRCALLKSEYEELNNQSPTDGSLYAFEILSSFFSEDKSFIKSIKSSPIEYSTTKETSAKKYDIYTVEIGTKDYIDALKASKDTKKSEVDDVEKILSKAVISAELWVEQKSDFVTKVVLNGNNFMQVLTPETEKLGLTSEHNTVTSFELSRFGLPTNIKKPDEFINYSELKKSGQADEKVLGTFDYQKVLN